MKNNSQDGTAELPSEQQKNIPVGTPVEYFSNGNWTNGFVVRDASNPDRVVIEKLGNPAVTRGTTYDMQLRWDIDVRPCQSAFKTEPEDPSQLDLDSLPF
jgi:hypothetical protein